MSPRGSQSLGAPRSLRADRLAEPRALGSLGTVLVLLFIVRVLPCLGGLQSRIRLYGPHGGDETFEVGDPTLKKETSNSIEFSVRRSSGPIHLTGNLYYEHFANFIFQNFTGEIIDGLPVAQFFSGKSNSMNACSAAFWFDRRNSIRR